MILKEIIVLCYFRDVRRWGRRRRRRLVAEYLREGRRRVEEEDFRGSRYIFLDIRFPPTSAGIEVYRCLHESDNNPAMRLQILSKIMLHDYISDKIIIL